jgi:hypothetical protein
MKAPVRDELGIVTLLTVFLILHQIQVQCVQNVPSFHNKVKKT